MWDAEKYDNRFHWVTDYGTGLVAMLDPKPGERILDLGCGTGKLTNDIASAGAKVIGIDSSPDMIEQARKNYPNLQFKVADALTFRTSEPFDAVFSNAVLHWVKPAEAGVETIAAALKPGGRMVVEFGGKGNTRSIVEAIGTNPWFYPSIGEYTSLLERHGLEPTTALLFPRPVAMAGEGGLRDWLKMFVASLVPDERVPAIEDALRSKLYRDGAWHIDYVRLRVIARKVGS